MFFIHSKAEIVSSHKNLKSFNSTDSSLRYHPKLWGIRGFVKKNTDFVYIKKRQDYMVSSAYSGHQNLCICYWGTAAMKFERVPWILPLKAFLDFLDETLFMPNEFLKGFIKNISIFIKNFRSKTTFFWWQKYFQIWKFYNWNY